MMLFSFALCCYPFVGWTRGDFVGEGYQLDPPPPAAVESIVLTLSDGE